ncbi:MAG: hypothetical protein R3300_11485, partial [Candidatus Promineifilaceae bacterium]|nr:hypothetical protein [Candidatus Promineifilaceae bacterium]
WPLIGGSGPLALFVEDLGLPVVSCGVGHPDSRAHAPNENLRLNDFVRGIRHTAYLVDAFSRQT